MSESLSESLTTDPTQAVERCWAAYRQTKDQAIADGVSRDGAKIRAQNAYLHAMPHLDTRDDIRGFLACIAEALLFDIIYRKDVPLLMAAARIAAAALPRETHPVGRPKPQPGQTVTDKGNNIPE